MKKIVIPVIALLLVASLAACKGKGDEIQYTGDFSENSSSSLPSDNINISSEPTSDNSAASTVLVALTTRPGETVEMVTTSEPLTAPPTIDYNPVDIPTSIPPINTTYVNQPSYSYNFTYPSDYTDNTTTTKPTTTEPAEKFVSVHSIGGVYSDETITVWVESNDKFGTKMKKNADKDKTVVTIKLGTLREYKASFTVNESLVDDGYIEIFIDTPAALAKDVAALSEDTDIIVEVKKGYLSSTKNVKNNAFNAVIRYRVSD